MTNQERAARLHGNGYNCCQAVLLTFCDELGVDPVTAFKIGEGFGLGMGGMAVSYTHLTLPTILLV